MNLPSDFCRTGRRLGRTRRMMSFADEILDRRGRLVAATVGVYARQLVRRPELGEIMRRLQSRVERSNLARAGGARPVEASDANDVQVRHERRRSEGPLIGRSDRQPVEGRNVDPDLGLRRRGITPGAIGSDKRLRGTPGPSVPGSYSWTAGGFFTICSTMRHCASTTSSRPNSSLFPCIASPSRR